MSNGQQHIHARKRIYKDAKPFPSPQGFTRVLDYSMYVVGLVAPLAILPQVLKLYTSHSVAGLSLTTWGLLTGVNGLWAVYGFVHRERSLFLSNFLITIMNALVSIGILLFR